MTVQLELPLEVANRLIAEAKQRDLSLDEYLLRRVMEEDSTAQVTTESGLRRIREDAGRRIRETRRGVLLGAELTIRDLVEEGRRF